MTPAPYPKPSHGSVICTWNDCPDRKERRYTDPYCKRMSNSARLLLCIPGNYCFRGFAR